MPMVRRVVLGAHRPCEAPAHVASPARVADPAIQIPVMTITPLNYYHVKCDYWDCDKASDCRAYINIAAKDHHHLKDVLRLNKWSFEGVQEVFTPYTTLCPAHADKSTGK